MISNQKKYSCRTFSYIAILFDICSFYRIRSQVTTQNITIETTIHGGQ